MFARSEASQARRRESSTCCILSWVHFKNQQVWVRCYAELSISSISIGNVESCWRERPGRRVYLFRASRGIQREGNGPYLLRITRRREKGVMRNRAIERYLTGIGISTSPTIVGRGNRRISSCLSSGCRAGIISKRPAVLWPIPKEHTILSMLWRETDVLVVSWH